MRLSRRLAPIVALDMAKIVGHRYQITIDKNLREQLRVRPGDLAVERVEGGRLVVEFIPRAHNESLLGIFKRPTFEPIDDWSRVKARAWQARSAEILGTQRDETG